MADHSDQHGEVSFSSPERPPRAHPRIVEVQRISKDNVSIRSDTTRKDPRGMPSKLGYVFQMLIRLLDIEHPGMGVAEEVRYEGQRTELFPIASTNSPKPYHWFWTHGDSSDRAKV